MPDQCGLPVDIIVRLFGDINVHPQQNKCVSSMLMIQLNATEQVVWGTSKEVGCGLTKCASVGGLQNANYLVCNYGPP